MRMENRDEDGGGWWRWRMEWRMEDGNEDGDGDEDGNEEEDGDGGWG